MIYYIPIIITIFFVFILLNLELKIIISLIIMSNGFDLLPKEISNIKLWDIGLILFYTSTIQAIFTKRNIFLIKNQPFYMQLFHGYFIINLISLVYSITIYKYPILYIVKSSRTIILGLLMYYIFMYLFSKNEKILINIHNKLYYIIYILTVLYVIQFFSGLQIYYGYYGEEGGLIRSIPIFYPLVIVYMWEKLFDFFYSKNINLINSIFILFSSVFLALTFTRGIYFALFINILIVTMILLYNYKIKLSRVIFSIFVATNLLLLIITSNSNTISVFRNRLLSSFYDIEFSSKKNEINTFNLRLEMFKERLILVLHKNPILGYGYIHEELAQKLIHFNIGTYNVKAKKQITFLSADNAWVNILIYTGFTGLIFFCAFSVLLTISPFFNFLKLYLIKNNTYTLNIIPISYYLGLLSTFILTFNGSVWTSNLQLYCFMLAVYSFLQRYQNQNKQNNFCVSSAEFVGSSLKISPRA